MSIQDDIFEVEHALNYFNRIDPDSYTKAFDRIIAYLGHLETENERLVKLDEAVKVITQYINQHDT